MGIRTVAALCVQIFKILYSGLATVTDMEKDNKWGQSSSLLSFLHCSCHYHHHMFYRIAKQFFGMHHVGEAHLLLTHWTECSTYQDCIQRKFRMFDTWLPQRATKGLVRDHWVCNSNFEFCTFYVLMGWFYFSHTEICQMRFYWSTSSWNSRDSTESWFIVQQSPEIPRFLRNLCIWRTFQVFKFPNPVRTGL